MLNSAATIFTMDIYQRHLKKDSSQKRLVAIGRVMTMAFVVIGCIIAPRLSDPRLSGVFHYIQEFQGYISPGILAAFVFGFIVKRTPPAAGVAALVLSAPVYGFLQWQFGSVAFLNRMAVTFGVVVASMAVITILRPLKEPRVMPVKVDYDTRPSKLVIALGTLVIAGVAVFYVIFW